MEEALILFSFVFNRPNGTIYWMIIGGLMYSIAINRHEQDFDKWLLCESGNWAMPLVDFYKIPFLKNFVDTCFREKNS